MLKHSTQESPGPLSMTVNHIVQFYLEGTPQSYCLATMADALVYFIYIHICPYILKQLRSYSGDSLRLALLYLILTGALDESWQPRGGDKKPE